MERDPEDISPDPNWERPSWWKWKEDWNSPNWIKKMRELDANIMRIREKYGFAECPKCGAQHTALTIMCRKCNYRAAIPKEEYDRRNDTN